MFRSTRRGTYFFQKKNKTGIVHYLTDKGVLLFHLQRENFVLYTSRYSTVGCVSCVVKVIKQRRRIQGIKKKKNKKERERWANVRKEKERGRKESE